MTVGERIKALREDKGLSQTELAELVGTSKQNIYKYETGIITNIPSDKIELISRCLDVTPCFIMGWTKEKNNAPVEVDKSVIASLLKTFSVEELHKIAELSREEAVEVVNYIDSLASKR